MSEKISIIVPCYNAVKYIDKCVASLVNQTIGLERMEIILVNDASTDNTYEKLCEWEQRYPDQIMIVNSEVNGYIGGARNIGMKYATGDYIGFCDSDDFVEPDMYETLFTAIREYGCEVSSVFMQKEDEKGNVLMQADFSHYCCNEKIVLSSVAERKEMIRKYLLETILPPEIKAKLYHRDFLEKSCLYFPEHLLNEDHFWWGLLQYQVRSFVIIDKACYHYVEHGNSVTSGSGRKHLPRYLDRLTIEVLKLEEYEKRGILDAYHEECEVEFLQLYWLNTLHGLWTRLRVCPCAIIDEMRGTVKQHFPNYHHNPYLTRLKEVFPAGGFFLSLLDQDIPEKELFDYAKEYAGIITGSTQMERI